MNVLALLLAVAAAAAPPHAENEVLAALQSQGVALGPDLRIPLPEPTLPDGLDPAGQRAVLAEIAGPAYPLDRFLRNSPVAPHVLKIEEVGQGDSRGRVVDVWFVAYGRLDDLADRAFVERALKLDDDQDLSSQGRTLDAAQLASRQIPWDEARSQHEAFAHGSVMLWKRVEVAATLRSYSSRLDESVIAAAAIDPRFNDDAQFPNSWRPLVLDKTGAVAAGPAQPYDGMGMYLKVTRLAEPPGALFCEWHLAFAEPHGWFDGANLLGSKLPAIVQSRVRALRREMALASRAP